MALKEGFTTGTAAAAAAKAAALLLVSGQVPALVEVPLPRCSPAPGRYTVPVQSCKLSNGAALASVVKDGGDDPDATHGAVIEATVKLAPPDSGIVLAGGRGVGRVTRPGLPVPVGEWAINPAPRQQIEAAVAEALNGRSAMVTIQVPDGEAIARRTLNPRLGIVGGISILGTRGTVKPFSNRAWRATIVSSLDVARAAGYTTAAMSTGGRSERFLMQCLPGLPTETFVQTADHFAFGMDQARQKGFTHVIWGVFFGKLLKQAQGMEDTHAKRGQIDFTALAAQARQAGVPEQAAALVEHANTGLHALQLLLGQPGTDQLFTRLAERAALHAQRFAGGQVRVRHVVFDFDGRVLAAYGPQP